LKEVGEARTADIADNIGLSSERTRVILANMDSVKAIGSNRNRTYCYDFVSTKKETSRPL
jgi:hypothetical protein